MRNKKVKIVNKILKNVPDDVPYQDYEEIKHQPLIIMDGDKLLASIPRTQTILKPGCRKYLKKGLKKLIKKGLCYENYREY